MVSSGMEKLGAQRPHGQVEHDHRGHRQREVVELDLAVLGPAPAFCLQEVGIGEVHQRTAHRPHHRQRHEQRVEPPLLPGHLPSIEALQDPRDAGPDPERRPHERDREHGQEELEDPFEPLVGRLEDQQQRHRVPDERPLPGLAEAEEVAAHLARSDRHVRLVHVPHHDGGGQQHGGVPGVQPREAVEDALAVRVAELVACDQRDEHEAQQDGQDEHPHQRVAVVAAGHRHVHDVAGAEPGEDDDDPGPERA